MGMEISGSRVRTGPKKAKVQVTYMRKGGAASSKSKGSKICPEGKAWIIPERSCHKNLVLG